MLGRVTRSCADRAFKIGSQPFCVDRRAMPGDVGRHRGLDRPVKPVAAVMVANPRAVGSVTSSIAVLAAERARCGCSHAGLHSRDFGGRYGIAIAAPDARPERYGIG